ncbi:HNH endonuclease [Streptomyces nodosus]
MAKAYARLMAQDRPDIPARLKRAVLVEAGHQCAIPTCRQTPVEIAHIDPWVKVKEHTFDNLIALCPTCHVRYDGRREIDRQAMLQYKQNLEVLNGRYTDVERQLLKVYAKMWAVLESAHHAATGDSIIDIMSSALGGRHTIGFGEFEIYEGMEWLLSNLLSDDVVAISISPQSVNQEPSRRSVSLTSKGLKMIQRIVAAEPI